MVYSCRQEKLSKSIKELHAYLALIAGGGEEQSKCNMIIVTHHPENNCTVAKPQKDADVKLNPTRR